MKVSLAAAAAATKQKIKPRRKSLVASNCCGYSPKLQIVFNANAIKQCVLVKRRNGAETRRQTIIETTPPETPLILLFSVFSGPIPTFSLLYFK